MGMQISQSNQEKSPLHLSVLHNLEGEPQLLGSEQQLRTLIRKKVSQDQYDEAINLLDRLLESNPDSAMDYNNRGLMHYRVGQFAEAIADLSVAIDLNPRLDSAYNNRANCYVAQGNFAAALTDYETALDYNPRNLRTWINQGILFRQLGLYDLALENFDLALVLGKRFQSRIYGERGRTYHLRGDWNLAIADYHRALDRDNLHQTSSTYQQTLRHWLNELVPPISA